MKGKEERRGGQRDASLEREENAENAHKNQRSSYLHHDEIDDNLAGVIVADTAEEKGPSRKKPNRSHELDCSSS